ncbi:hypothetical protein RJD40_20045 [Vibrio scophthalmi]|uniref:hypothetical protein n=1 Tax=Vibrio scophthalmi TaxID=45658 RepID=UPI003AAF5600
MNQVILCEGTLYFLSIKKAYFCKESWDVAGAISDFLGNEPYELINDDSFQLNEAEHGSSDKWEFF